MYESKIYECKVYEYIVVSEVYEIYEYEVVSEVYEIYENKVREVYEYISHLVNYQHNYIL
jgi:hypothetical protein